MTQDIQNKPNTIGADKAPSPRATEATALGTLTVPEPLAPAIDAMLRDLPNPSHDAASTVSKFGTFKVGNVTVSFRRATAA